MCGQRLEARRFQEPGKVMKLLGVIVGIGVTIGAPVAAAAADPVTGAGSTFIAPLLLQWAAAAKPATGVTVDYVPAGSGVGIQRITNGAVTFGATDMPLTPEDVAANHLIQFPLAGGAVVPVFNLPGIEAGALTLDGPTLAKIFLGTITRWNDPAIARLNPRLTLPAMPMTVVHRADASGTTFIWTDYLAKVSADWQAKVGENLVVGWPAGIGAKGNEGVSTDVAQTTGAIGYVEYAYAQRNNLSTARMINRAGKPVVPTLAAFQATTADTDWKEATDFGAMMTDAPGDAAWPMAGATFILMKSVPLDPAGSAAALKFFAWAYRHGSEAATALGYVPMPQSVVAQIEKLWAGKPEIGGGSPAFGR
jgi:phosphate transport system substrate-binding protein